MLSIGGKAATNLKSDLHPLDVEPIPLRSEGILLPGGKTVAQEIMIPDFTADDYKKSDAPFAWLYQYKNNKFLLKQLTIQMQEKAGAVGVRGFIALFNAYCEGMAQRQGITLERTTEFEGQPLELLCGEYICNESGVFMLDKYGYQEMICRHAILPTMRLVNIDSGEERLELAYKKGKVWRYRIIEKSVIASSNKILDLAAFGIMVNSQNAKTLSTYILDIEQMNYETIPEQKSVGRLGWVFDHGFSPYVDELTFDGESNFKHTFEAVKSAGSRQKWIEAMKHIRAEKTVGRIFLAASFASAILEPCGLLPFFVHAWGGQGNGKTVSLMIAASVWANPKMGEYITTFNSTDVGQEMMASFLNSLPLCMDELQIQAASGIRDFDKTIYKLTEGIGKTRGAKTGGIRKVSTWKNCILTTGEYPIINSNSMGGATVRVIEFECAEKVFSDLVGLCAVLNENYGFAGREFVEYLQTGDNADKVNTIQKDFYRELLKTDSADKQAASASAILAADKIATELFFHDDNALTVADMAQIMTKKEEINVNARTLEFVYELISRNTMHFRGSEYGDYKTEVWGKIDDDYVYIIKSVFDRELKLEGYNASSFLSWAKREKLIECDKGGRRTKKAYIAGTSVNTVCIIKDSQGRREREEEFNRGIDELPY